MQNMQNGQFCKICKNWKFAKHTEYANWLKQSTPGSVVPLALFCHFVLFSFRVKVIPNIFNSFVWTQKLIYFCFKKIKYILSAPHPCHIYFDILRGKVFEFETQASLIANTNSMFYGMAKNAGITSANWVCAIKRL